MVFLIQVAGLSIFHLPFGGFSLYLITLIILISLQEGLDCVVIGFIGGFIYDLNPSITSPMCEWALIFTAVGYFYMSYKPAIHDILERPFLGLMVFSLTMISVLVTYQLLSAVFGSNLGNLVSVALEILAAATWTILIGPIILGPLQKFNTLLVSSRQR
jgi:hypothetical protein